jgi:hypothetical protein
MIFVNKHADYSANAIGYIEIPINISEKTQAIINQFSTEPSAVKKAAIDSFVNSLDAAGIYEKINMLLLPCLAKNVNEAYIDVINKDASMLHFPNVAAYVTNNIAVDDYGIKEIGTGDVNTAPTKSKREFNGTLSLFSSIHINKVASFCLGGVGEADTVTCWYNKRNSRSTRKGSMSMGVGINHEWELGKDYSEVCLYPLDTVLTETSYIDYINGTKQEIEYLTDTLIARSVANESMISPYFATANRPAYINENSVSVWGTASGLNESDAKLLSEELQKLQRIMFA